MKARLPQGMGRGPSDFSSMMKQAQKMQAEMEKMKAMMQQMQAQQQLLLMATTGAVLLPIL